MRTLAIDIGGTGLKMLVLDPEGVPITGRTRVRTPSPATPDTITAALAGMAIAHGPFDRVSCGFPGVVVDGVTLNAPNLHPSWAGVDLAARLTDALCAPTRVANDADVQGFGAIEGRGVELVVTLGTGIGSALFLHGQLVPNLELGHAPFRKDRSFEAILGKAALGDSGPKKWRKRLSEAIDIWLRLFNPRVLYLGGGNAKKVDVLPAGVQRVDNTAGLLGGIALWR